MTKKRRKGSGRTPAGQAKGKSRPTRGKKQRAAEARARARRRELFRRVYWSGAGLLIVGLVTAALLVTRDAGSAAADEFDLPAMGPTAEQQERVRLADLQGKPTVVNFFASWCTACDAELPGFATLSRQLDGQ
ncbi:MAG: TlpA family protein disulfide reductase, partial [Nitriliruptorales bacterium]